MARGTERDPARDLQVSGGLSGGPGAHPNGRTETNDRGHDAASEDFLFHLYRGSELLQDNRVHEAKTELEFALTLQPRDTKGQDLLALVYFRIGLYPRAIRLYEDLLRENPHDPSLLLNLALCYLKTGQAQAARQELEELVQKNPEHRRAWGYLGLALQRLGDYAKAQHAFDRGGHASMSKRMSERAGAIPAPSVSPPEHVAGAAQLRAAAAVAFEELDSGELSFALAEPEAPAKDGNNWTSVEPGATTPQASTPPNPRHRNTLVWGLPHHESDENEAPTTPSPLQDLARETRLRFPERGVALTGSGLALVRTLAGGPENDFAVRLEALRGYTGALSTTVLQRQARGQALQETFGGIGSPIVGVSGAAELVLGPRASHRMFGFSLRNDVAFVREEALLGFEMCLAFENGRLAVGEGDAASMVQLRGSGVVLMELMDAIASLEVMASRSVHIRREVLVGWAGRLVPRALSVGEAPAGQRGLVSFSGEGAVLVAIK